MIDEFSKKLLTSGYTLVHTRRITINGIGGWGSRKEVARQERRRVFKTASDSLAVRIRKKLTGKTSWYKPGKKNNKKNQCPPPITEEDMRGEHTKTRTGKLENKDRQRREDPDTNMKEEDRRGEKDARTMAVMFIDNTKNRELAKNMRSVVKRIKGILGFKIKIVERSRTPLKLMFPLSKIGEGREGGRGDCVTCTQEGRGEKLPPCNKRSVQFENICTLCNPGVGDGKEKEFSPPDHPPSIYVGETSRTLYERSKEHWRAFRNQQEDSHIHKHHQLNHGGAGEPSFQ